MLTLLLIIAITLGFLSILIFTLWQRLGKQAEQLIRMETRWTDITPQLATLNQHQLSSLKLLQDSLQSGMQTWGQQLADTQQRSGEQLSGRIDKLVETVEQKLREISGQVEKRLSDGFAQTTATFTDIIKRLALIDEAQKHITELSSNVVSLQEVLSDKRSRGVFGEVQLNALIRNAVPESLYALQYTLSNNKRADCVLFLPPPTGTIAIDAKFPLENYRRATDIDLSATEREAAEKQFRLDIRNHIQDIASKYIIPGETAEGAILFIPAEAIFAEIHARYYDLVEEAYRARVWLTSPTTMMAILTTARAAIKDAATREQVHIIQKHLADLAKDFARFQQRMTNLARHIDQAHGDIQEVKTSAEKITSRFEKIEKVELELLE